jgi:HSP20 family protein
MLLRRISDRPSYSFRSQFEELDRMRREVNRIARSQGSGVFSQRGAGVFPLMNITEDSDKFVVRAELPGMKADEIDISVTRDTLSISGERKIHAESEDAKYHRREREAGKFSRIFSMPSLINPEKVEATSVDGILTVVLTKAEESKPKQIRIKSK